MKYAYLALVPLLLAPGSIMPEEFTAFAQQHRPHPSQGSRPPEGGSHANRPPSGGGNTARPPHGGNTTRPPGGGGARPPGGGGNPNRPPSGNQRPPAGWQPPPGHSQRPPSVHQPHRPGAGRPPTYRPMRAPPFRYPRGYSYRRWSTHMIMPAIFLSSAYLFQDYAMIGVGPPPPGYYWVRYGPDLLLVRRYDRMVVDVIYGAFYW